MRSNTPFGRLGERRARITLEGMVDARPTSFTPRQSEVVRLIALGCSNEEVGTRLGISARTAKAHADTLRQKLGVSRRRQIPAAYRALTGDDPLSESLEPLRIGLGD